jgi:asparagine synthase (glutamine-hydrolysing)
MTRFDAGRRSRLVRPEIAEAMPRQSPRGWLSTHFDEPADADYLTRIQYTDFMSYLPEDVLTKVDRASMMHSLEVRVPLLDHRLAEYAFHMPSRLKIRRGTKKWALKRAFRDRIDPSILNRPKMGFGIPIDAWLRGPLAPMARELLLGTPDPFLEPRAIERFFEEHTTGAAPWGYPLWNLLVLKMWLHQQGVA